MNEEEATTGTSDPAGSESLIDLPAQSTSKNDEDKRPPPQDSSLSSVQPPRLPPSASSATGTGTGTTADVDSAKTVSSLDPLSVSLSNSNEWQVVETPKENTTTDLASSGGGTSGGKAQKWKDRLAQKQQQQQQQEKSDDEEPEVAVEDSTQEEKDESIVAPETTANEQASASSTAALSNKSTAKKDYTSKRAQKWKQRLASKKKTSTSTEEEETEAVNPITKKEEEANTESAHDVPTPNQDASTPSKTNLTASYQDIRQEKQVLEEDRKAKEEQATEMEKQAIEAKRLAKIAQLEETRRQVRAEEARKAREEEAKARQAQEAKKKKAQPSTADTAESSQLLMVVSNFFGTTAQRATQDMARTMLRSHGIGAVKEIDESDPTHKEQCNELFAISGIRDQYPQFFVVRADSSSAFLGDYEALQGIVESGTLKKQMGISTVEKEPTRTEPVSTSKVATSSVTKTLIVLISKSFGTATQRGNQDMALTILRSKGIPFDEVDGSNPAYKEQRSKLFEISGIRGKYPQFFVQDQDNITSFLADYDDFQALNEAGSLTIDYLLKGSDTTASSSTPETAEPTLPKPNAFSSTNDRQESLMVPTETFENEYDVPSAPRTPGARRMDSNRMPSESFENEFDVTGSRTSSIMDRMDSNRISSETFENEFNTAGSRTSTSSRITGRMDSNRTPSETFENEYDIGARNASSSSSVLGGMDSNSMDSETFENEFEVPSPARGRMDSDRMPSETFENEFDVNNPSGATITRAPLPRKGTMDRVEEDGDDEDFEAKPEAPAGNENDGAASNRGVSFPGESPSHNSSSESGVDTNLAMAVLAVAVIVGIVVLARH